MEGLTGHGRSLMLQIERVEAAAERFPSEGMLLAGRSIVGSASQI